MLQQSQTHNTCSENTCREIIKHVVKILYIVNLAITRYHQNSSKVDESMKFGMMVGIDHTNKFWVVAKVKYA